MATKTAVKVHFKAKKGRKAKTVTFHKSGTKASLCAVTTIRLKGKTFKGRRGGRALCGGGHSAAKAAVRRAFKTCAKSKSGVTKSCMAKHGA